MRTILVPSIALLLLATTACSNLSQQEQRMLTGGALGAAGGAVIGALTGGVVLGTALGAAAGTAIGALTSEEQVKVSR